MQKAGCKKQGVKNRVIVIQKEKRQPSLQNHWFKIKCLSNFCHDYYISIQDCFFVCLFDLCLGSMTFLHTYMEAGTVFPKALKIFSFFNFYLCGGQIAREDFNSSCARLTRLFRVVSN